jgi:hypothetical protein
VRKRSVLDVLLLVLFSAVLSLAQAGKVEIIAGPSEASIPQAVRDVLDTKGYRVSLDDGSVACEIWLRRAVPSQAKKDVAGALYPQLAESTMLGIISFPHPATDYRGQPVKSGIYTLRYELIPGDGNHLGVAPNRDFVLLIPAASDSDPNVTFKFDELVNLSRKTTGTRHPAPLNLPQPAGAAGTVSKDDEDHWILSAEVKLASGESLPFALVVKGTAPQ